MKKTIVKFLTIVATFLVMYGYFFTFLDSGKTSIQESLLLENVEALAGGEADHSLCLDYGDIDCMGAKVKFKYDYFSLKNEGNDR